MSESAAATAKPLLEVHHLVKEYRSRRGLWQRRAGVVRAVDDVAFEIWRGETLGLVGESGCGKSTLAKTILRLTEPTAGRVILRVNDSAGHRSYPLFELDARPLRRLRRHMQIVFQNPFRSFNARLTIGESIAEGVRNGGSFGPAECRRRVSSLLDRVGVDAGAADRYPYSFSGGQLQRLSVARALACEPALIVCDEVCSALDVSVQAQLVNLLAELQRERNVAYLFISHDIRLVARVSQRMAVMRAGRIVELAATSELLNDPRHAYSRQLLSAEPETSRLREARFGRGVPPYDA